MTAARAHPLPTAKSRQRREELLTAAQRVFAEHGYFDTRIADVVAVAEVAHGTFYTYFSSKDDVLRALVGRMSDDLFELTSHPVERSDTPFLMLEATIRQFMHAYRDWAGLLRILDQAVAFSDEFLVLRQQIRDRFGERIERAIRAHQGRQGRQRRQGRQAALDPALAAYALGGMVEDFARGCYTLGHPVEEEQAVSTLAVIWARAVGLDF